MPDEIPTISSNQAKGWGPLVAGQRHDVPLGPYAGGSFQSGKEAVTCRSTTRTGQPRPISAAEEAGALLKRSSGRNG